MRVTLKQLAVFDAVARFNSINKAAEEISLSPSAVSLALKELETSLGVQLFERHKRTLHLNQNGRRLQTRTRSILHLVDELEGRAQQPALSGTLRIVAGATAGHELLAPVCAGFMADHPDVALRLNVGSSAEVVELVDGMKHDIGFIDSLVNRASLEVLPWVTDRVGFFCAPDHPLAGETVEPGALKNETWLLQPLGSFTRATLNTELRKYIPTLKVGFESNSIDMLKRLAMQGAGIGCLSMRLLQPELDRGALALVHVPAITTERTLHIIVKRGVYSGEIITAFIESCRQAAGPAP